MRTFFLGLGSCCILAIGCGDDSAVGDEGPTSSADDDGSTANDDVADDGSSAGVDSSGDGSGDASTGATTGVPADCGDGERQGLEQCDDMNDEPGDGCEPGCLLPSGEPVWSATVDAEGGDDVANAVAVAGNGDIVVVGGQTIGAAMDVWVARYDAAGEPLSSTTIDFGEGADDVANGVAVLDDGAMAIVGTREQASDPMLDDALVVVLEADGTERWSVFVASELNDRGEDVAIGDGGIAVAGMRADPTTEDDAWFAVYDPADGAEVFSQTDAGTGNSDDGAFGIAWTAAGGLVVVGLREGNGDDDLWVSGRDASGAEQWTDVQDFDFGDDFALDVVVDGDTAWVTGMISSALTNSEEIWIAGYGADGTPGDSTTWNSTGFFVDSGNAIAIDAGQVFIVGDSAATDEQKNVFVGRFGSGMPEPVWSDTQDGGAGLQDNGTGVALLSDGSIVATGVVTVIGEGTNAWIRRYAP